MVSSSGSPPPYDLGDDVCVRQVISIRHRVPGVPRAPKPAGRPGAGFEGWGRGRENKSNGAEIPHDAGSAKTDVFRAPDAACCGDRDFGTHRVGDGQGGRWQGRPRRPGAIVARDSLPIRALDRLIRGIVARDSLPMRALDRLAPAPAPAPARTVPGPGSRGRFRAFRLL